MNITGIKTKGGFPTIECKAFEDVSTVDTPHKFYDETTKTYYAFANGFFYSYQQKFQSIDVIDEIIGREKQRRLQRCF